MAAYLKETGDWGILNEPVPYDNAPGSEQPLYEHLQRSFQYTLDRLGPHGLPLIGRADWNDCLNLNCFSDTPGQSFQTTTNKEGKVAESIFIAGLFCLAGRELAEITVQKTCASHAGTGKCADAEKQAKKYLAEVAKMEDTIRKHGWDGEWFLRAYDDFGNKVGSKECEEGKIFIETQGFCTLAGVGLDDGTALKALESTRQHLATKHGIVLQQPAFSKYYLHLGEISSYPPGYKENAGIFCHNNPWVMIGETRVGNGDAAFDYYSLHQSFGARRDQRPAPLRALRVCANDCGPRCSYARRGEEFVADRNRGVELLRNHAMDSWHPYLVQRLADCARGAEELARVQSNQEIPRRDF